MHTDKDLRNKFASSRDEYPIWYYKKLQEIDIEDVIFYLLKKTFVVELGDRKITMTFGKNDAGEIGCTQSCNQGLKESSYKNIRKAFSDGKWFEVIDTDTDDDFKSRYRMEEAERKRLSMRESRICVLNKIIENYSEHSDERKVELKEGFSRMSDSQLEQLTDTFFSGIDNN